MGCSKHLRDAKRGNRQPFGSRDFTAIKKVQSANAKPGFFENGGYKIRTCDPLLVRQVL